MGDEVCPPTKRGRFKETQDPGNSVEDPKTKRQQVDAHVQAFLKTVLDHAKSKSLLKASKTRKPKQVRDASTQTEGVAEDCMSICQWNNAYEATSHANDFTYCDTQQSNVGTQNDCSFVPNRAMYSQETLQLASEQKKYYNHLQSEFSTTPDVPQTYFTNNSFVATTETESSKSGEISSSELRRAVTEWAEKYQHWFFQNFGLDVKAATSSYTGITPLTTCALNTNYPSEVTLSNSVSSTNQSEVVVSGAPVSYLVPEGSMCMPENHIFSPYVSLLPSFYTSAAFGYGIPPQHELTINHVPLCTSVPLVLPQSQVASVAATQPLFVQSQQLSGPPFTNLSTPLSVCPPVTPDPISTMSSDSNQSIGVPVTSFSDLPAELQTSAMLAALSFPMHSNRQPSMGQWGPLLRYGTYGRLPSPCEIQQLRLCGNSQSNSIAIPEEKNSFNPHELNANKMPPPPPTFILLRRQAMICALQLSCRERGRELFFRERESTSGMKVDFVSELEQVVEKSINLKPVFLFMELSDLPESERSYFLKDDEESEIRSRTGQNQQPDPLNPAQMYACDLLIGDVLIAEACSTYKQQAQNCVARQAFKILSQPCFLVGSVRRWELVDYLVLCLSSKADLVPKLPPFLSDPFESLSKKDRTIDPAKPNEPFDVVNPKPPEDFWLYLADLPMTSLADEAYFQRILSQSAVFSQMTVAFDVEVNTETGLFLCSALIDNHRYPSVAGSTVSEAEKLAIKELMTVLKSTQPIVGAVPTKSGNRWKSERVEPLWGVSERALIDTLMWGKEERDLAIDIEQLEAHCDVPELSDLVSSDTATQNTGGQTENPKPETDRFSSPQHLENFVQAYAASALVTPLRLSSRTVPPRVWPFVRQVARNWGLLSCIEKQHLVDNIILCVLICKRAPLPRLKRTLYERSSYGCFSLLNKGNLPNDAQRRLLMVEPLIYDDVSDAVFPDDMNSSAHHCNLSSYSSFSMDDSDPYSEEPVTRLARHFIATGSKCSSVKNEPELHEDQQPFEDCVLLAAELNQPSNAIEILDDLPKTLIPGIDF